MLFPMLRDSDPLLFTTYSISGFKLFFFLTRSLSIPQPVLHVLLRDTFLYMYMQEAFTFSLYASVFILCAFDGSTNNILAFNFKQR